MAVLGVDLGGTKLLVCAIDAGARVVLRVERPTGRDFGPVALLGALEEAAAAARAADGPVTAIGVAFPGLTDHERGVVRSSVMLDEWKDVPLRFIDADSPFISRPKHR